MKIIEREINDLHTVKTEEEMEFYPGHQADLLQLEELLDISNGDIKKDLLAIEETDLVKSENLKVENEMVRVLDFAYSGTPIIQMDLCKAKSG
ncbi:uncharacterized protein LOC142333578 isoform X2 [Lycorma delicatula]|uniref:uncharacterized protein LOC142333578 isoform X2 n=1 Tax=Lycorma delicatula TaxID=130591 RepID=UPI003F50E911